MTENKTHKSEYANTPYDDVYRTLLNDCPGLIIPVVNEIFGKNHKADKEITLLNNELFLNRQDGKQLERITDTNFRIEESRYHIECQSTPDGSILIRIFEYASQIALQDSILEADRLQVTFPNTGILYLRHNRNTPDEMTVTIQVPGDCCSYPVPIIKVQQYTIDEIFEKKLYFLIPFHIFVFEKRFRIYETDEQKRQELLEIYEEIMRRLNADAKAGKINELIKATIVDMSKKVLEHLSRGYAQVREGVRGVMGGQILEYEAKTIYKKGIEYGIEQGIERGIEQGIERGIEQGIERGIKQGKEHSLVEQIRKKRQKGQELSVIAEALEETEERIEELIRKYEL